MGETIKGTSFHMDTIGDFTVGIVPALTQLHIGTLLASTNGAVSFDSKQAAPALLSECGK